MAAIAPIFWAHLIEVHQGVHSASRSAYDVRTPWEARVIFKFTTEERYKNDQQLMKAVVWWQGPTKSVDISETHCTTRAMNELLHVSFLGFIVVEFIEIGEYNCAMCEHENRLLSKWI